MNPLSLSPQAIPLLLMVAIAPIAAIDILYFHLWKFRLYQAPSARGETVTHLIRGTFFSTGAFLLSSYRLSGAWLWVVGVLFLLDFLNSLVDGALEHWSRAPLGGLPPLEYVIHILASSFAGGITVAYFMVGWSNGWMATGISPLGGTLPQWLVWQGWLLAAGGLVLTLIEGGLFLRSFMVPALRTAT
jgi:hypothetical protein